MNDPCRKGDPKEVYANFMDANEPEIERRTLDRGENPTAGDRGAWLAGYVRVLAGRQRIQRQANAAICSIRNALTGSACVRVKRCPAPGITRSGRTRRAGMMRSREP